MLLADALNLFHWRTFTNLRTMLVAAIVHHGDHPLLSVFDPWYFLCIKEACLVPIEFAEDIKKKTCLH